MTREEKLKKIAIIGATYYIEEEKKSFNVKKRNNNRFKFNQKVAFNIKNFLYKRK